MLSCSTTRTIEVPVETVKEVYIKDTKIDSVYVYDKQDSYTRNDTVFTDKVYTIHKYTQLIDTVIKTDSIPKIVKVEKEVEVNHIYWYQNILMWIGGISMVLLLLYLFYKIKLK